MHTMNDKHDEQPDEVAEVRELTADEVMAVAGGPQVINDGPLTGTGR